MTENAIEYERLLELQAEGREAAEEMRLALNKAIRKYNLRADATLCLLARLSANLIHSMQSHCHTPQSRDQVEDQFHAMLDSYLALMDERDVKEKLVN